MKKLKKIVRSVYRSEHCIEKFFLKYFLLPQTVTMSIILS